MHGTGPRIAPSGLKNNVGRTDTRWTKSFENDKRAEKKREMKGVKEEKLALNSCSVSSIGFIAVFPSWFFDVAEFDNVYSCRQLRTLLRLGSFPFRKRQFLLAKQTMQR